MNYDYFSGWAEDAAYSWTHKEVIYYGSNFYLFGARK
jgi:hypothetical protein